MTTPAIVAWLTGLPASGKSTLARRVRDRCQQAGRCCALLDGDEVRAAIAPTVGYDDAGRDAFYTALSGLAALLSRQGLVVIVAATAHRRAWREHARAVAPQFLEVHVATPLATCEARDVKGLYTRARAGKAPRLPGVDESYEEPGAPDVVASGGEDDAALARIVAEVLRATSSSTGMAAAHEGDTAVSSRATSTGAGASRSISSETEPSSHRESPVRPCVPTTSRS
jgi:adenylylsulfate kinase